MKYSDLFICPFPSTFDVVLADDIYAEQEAVFIGDTPSSSGIDELYFRVISNDDKFQIGLFSEVDRRYPVFFLTTPNINVFIGFSGVQCYAIYAPNIKFFGRIFMKPMKSYSFSTEKRLLAIYSESDVIIIDEFVRTYYWSTFNPDEIKSIKFEENSIKILTSDIQGNDDEHVLDKEVVWSASPIRSLE